MKFLSAQALAAELGRSPWWVCQARKAGLGFPYGGRTTLRLALDWLSAHQDFKACDFVSVRSVRGGGRPLRGAGKSDAQSNSHDQQSASQSPDLHPHEQAA